MAGFQKTISKASLDAGLGLIYRLNTLFNKAEDAAMSGDFDRWNFILDRIYVNLTYKDGMEVEYRYDDNENIIGITKLEQPKNETMIYDKFSEILRDIIYEKTFAMRRKKRSLYSSLHARQYKVLMKKDIWLRKVMMERGLYLKESSFDPTKAMWGG